VHSKGRALLSQYFKERSLVQSDIDSFNNFIEYELQRIIDENSEIIPTIIPQNVEEYKIRLEKIRVGKPEITEADGSKRPIMPIEARIRNISYAAPIFLTVSSIINGAQRESIEAQIGKLPIMVKSKICNLHGLKPEELAKLGEDADDPGGYFIVNGSEKVLVKVEDLASNHFMVEKNSVGSSEFTGRVFSEQGSYKILHNIERLKDGIFYLSFVRLQRVPLVVVIKALGLLKDEDIMKATSDEIMDEVFINLFEFGEIKNAEDAMDALAKKSGITQSRQIRLERIADMLDRYLLPQIGTDEKSRLLKAHNLCKMMKKFILVERGKLRSDEKDHYMNKRVKQSGDLLADLFRVNLKVLVSDLLYNFQRIVKRGKFPQVKVIIREKLLTSRLQSAMATGSWVGGRKGISQRIQRRNFLDLLSHLQRVVSPLSSQQENFRARALHPTHYGRLCPIETPEGTNIGLKKNISLLGNITNNEPEKELIKKLKEFGMGGVA
jgi:DNA-directed RNA polymerase subunit B